MVREYGTTTQRKVVTKGKNLLQTFGCFRFLYFQKGLAYTGRPEMLHRFIIFPKNILGHILNTWGSNRLIGTWAILTRFTSTPSHSFIHLFINGPQRRGLTAWFSTVAPLSCIFVPVLAHVYMYICLITGPLFLFVNIAFL